MIFLFERILVSMGKLNWPSEKNKPLLELEEEVLQEWLFPLLEERDLTTRRQGR